MVFFGVGAAVFLGLRAFGRSEGADGGILGQENDVNKRDVVDG